jgi:hypothetical protein
LSTPAMGARSSISSGIRRRHTTGLFERRQQTCGGGVTRLGGLVGSSLPATRAGTWPVRRQVSWCGVGGLGLVERDLCRVKLASASATRAAASEKFGLSSTSNWPASTVCPAAAKPGRTVPPVVRNRCRDDGDESWLGRTRAARTRSTTRWWAAGSVPARIFHCCSLRN